MSVHPPVRPTVWLRFYSSAAGSRCGATTEKNSFRFISSKFVSFDCVENADGNPRFISPHFSPSYEFYHFISVSPRPISFHLFYSNLILFHAISFRSILFWISNPFQSTPFHPILPYLLRIRPPRRIYNVFPVPYFSRLSSPRQDERFMFSYLFNLCHSM